MTARTTTHIDGHSNKLPSVRGVGASHIAPAVYTTFVPEASSSPLAINIESQKRVAFCAQPQKLFRNLPIAGQAMQPKAQNRQAGGPHNSEQQGSCCQPIRH